MKCLILISALGGGALLLLNVYIFHVQQSGRVPLRNPAELDFQGRKAALEIRKQLLNVSGLPYVATSREILIPLHNDTHQRFVSTQFTDEQSGLLVGLDTHLCLPGIDPCISGGEVTLFDGITHWSLTFQFLGSENPSAFRSHLPKSRALLSRMRTIGNQAPTPRRSDYYAALQNTLTFQAGSQEMQSSVVQLLRLLLASYFASAEFADSLSFAEQNELFIHSRQE